MTSNSAPATATAPHAGSVCPSTAARILLEQLAVETETRIHETFQFQMRYGETTITDNNLLAIRRAHLPTIQRFHGPPLRERDFGYDWEWWIRVGNSAWTVLFVQAKKLNPKKGTYDGLSHKVPGTKQPQIELLWQHAKQLGGIPLYSFYNGPRPAVVAWNCHTSRDDQQF